MEYKTESEIADVVDSFEKASIRRENWGHAEHLIVGFHYARESSFDDAFGKMRNGIMRLLQTFEIDLSREMPYHETLTFFWLKAIFDFKNSRNDSDIVTAVNELIERMPKDYPLRFYSPECLFSERARREYVEPDL